jgi:hypothetical protein
MSTSEHFSTPVVLTLNTLLTLVQTALVNAGESGDFIDTMNDLIYANEIDLDEVPAVRLVLKSIDTGDSIRHLLNQVEESNRLIMGSPALPPLVRKMVPAKRVAKRAPRKA